MRAWTVFQVSLAAAFIGLLTFLFATLALHAQGGDLAPAQTEALLKMLYWGTYPLVFIALGSLLWHFVRRDRGDYAGQ